MPKIETKIDVESPKEPFLKGAAQQIAFSAQNYSTRLEAFLANRSALFNELFVRTRDVLVSDDLNIVYFPIPKSACTFYVTMMALNDSTVTDFDPALEGIHRYRFKHKLFRPKNLSPLHSQNYFKFSVIREPCRRAVSGFLDKFVKPFWSDKKLNRQLALNLTFEQLVELLVKTPDSFLDKHFRSQYRFFNGIKLDHLGILEDMSVTNELLKARLNTDFETQVDDVMYAKARTSYSSEAFELDNPCYEMTPCELAELPQLPRAELFLSDAIKCKLSARFAKDITLYELAQKQTA